MKKYIVVGLCFFIFGFVIAAFVGFVNNSDMALDVPPDQSGDANMVQYNDSIRGFSFLYPFDISVGVTDNPDFVNAKYNIVLSQKRLDGNLFPVMVINTSPDDWVTSFGLWEGIPFDGYEMVKNSFEFTRQPVTQESVFGF